MEKVLQKRSNLVMPTVGYELDKEEMSYVDGGTVFDYYLSNAQAWDAVSDIVGGYSNVNKAIIAGVQTSLISIVAKGVKTFAFAAKMGAVPVVGWVALGILALAAVTVATVIIGCLVSGTGFGITLNWAPKWYNPFNGLDLNIGWR